MSGVICPSHAPMQQFEVIDDRLHLHGVPIDRLAQRIGRTPFYAYDRSVIDRRIAELRHHLPAEVHLHYAIKANPMPAVVQHLARHVDGLDVASAGEMHIALDTGMAPERISFAGPGKTEAELMQAVAAGVVINIESERELDIIERCGAQAGVRPSFAIRVNPDFELKSSGMKMGGGPKQFGIDAEQVPALFARAKSLDARFVGLHIFSGSQNLRAESIVEAQQKSLELALRLAEQAPAPIEFLNIGGGFGIPYFPGDKPLDLGPIAQNLNEIVVSVRRSLAQAQVVIELGRYLVGEAGVYVCRIVDRKISRGEVFLVTDGGLHHHLAASGNFGQVIRKNYPVIVANRVAGTEREVANVVGPLCTPLDLLAARMELAQAEPGDLVAVLQSGAYGLTASPTAFLGHPAPLEVLV
ncbi:MAG: pyridoxal-dependent decarboxylase, exosortase A system-associated [Betaproteobacteria bacterium]|nr:pyridoxal-dependent decarboxylase, exosortase A system-associated [Betaproteobacteria bacterium]